MQTDKELVWVVHFVDLRRRFQEGERQSRPNVAIVLVLIYMQALVAR